MSPPIVVTLSDLRHPKRSFRSGADSVFASPHHLGLLISPSYGLKASSYFLQAKPDPNRTTNRRRTGPAYMAGLVHGAREHSHHG